MVEEEAVEEEEEQEEEKIMLLDEKWQQVGIKYFCSVASRNQIKIPNFAHLSNYCFFLIPCS